MLEVRDLFKSYGKMEAVKGINFQIKPGEIFGFLGPNGAGKTTTIKICSGLLKADSGKVLINSYDIQKEPVEAKRNLGYVPENPYLYDRLTAREFLQLVSDIYLKDLDFHEKESRINNILELLEMDKRADELIGSYSKGMGRKIILAAAFLHRPKVVLLDEPTHGLDAYSAKTVKDLFRKQANEGSAILLTTHVMEIAERLCDRIAVIYEGKIKAVGTLEQLRQKATSKDSSLEDIFLKLTKKEETEEVAG
ncbi:ABC transporter ATP-binding protein [Natronospora cellulosivora (SeqCode)]